MNKKLIMIIIAVILVVCIILGFIYINNSHNYIVKVNMVDERSPDRTLTVYEGDKLIEYKEIKYMDDTHLCSYKNPSVYFGDILNETKLKIVLTNNKVVTARIDKGEEK